MTSSTYDGHTEKRKSKKQNARKVFNAPDALRALAFWLGFLGFKVPPQVE